MLRTFTITFDAIKNLNHSYDFNFQKFKIMHFDKTIWCMLQCNHPKQCVNVKIKIKVHTSPKKALKNYHNSIIILIYRIFH